MSVVFPQIEIGDDPIVIMDFVQAVEGMGYDCLHVPDMVIGSNPDRPGGINRGPPFKQLGSGSFK